MDLGQGAGATDAPAERLTLNTLVVHATGHAQRLEEVTSELEQVLIGVMGLGVTDIPELKDCDDNVVSRLELANARVNRMTNKLGDILGALKEQLG